MLVEHPVDISIILPVYNAGKYVGWAVRSVLEQDYDGTIELIAVDDGSTDESMEIIRDLAVANDHMLVRLISQDNSGPAAARNAGLKFAAGEFIGFLDADDQLMPGFCSKMIAAARRDEADLVLGRRKKSDSDKDLRNAPAVDWKDFGHNRHSIPFEQDFLADLFWEKEMGNSVWNKLYRKELIGKFSPAQYYEDYPFNLEYISHCSVITSIPEEVYCYRVGTGHAINDKRYSNCGWEAQVVEEYIVRRFIESTTGEPLRESELAKADRWLFSQAGEAVVGGVAKEVIENSNRYKEALARTQQPRN